VGFNLTKTDSTAAETGGFGLFSIRERLEQVGGRLKIDSQAGKGTKITIIAPLKQISDN
jgi:signal transduction histidine kinase